jgi:IS30 family transposase
MDLIEGKRGTNCNLLTLCERKTRKGIAIKINNKKKETINKTMKLLQSKNTLMYGINIKSLTPDNGSEFWG